MHLHRTGPLFGMIFHGKLGDHQQKKAPNVLTQRTAPSLFATETSVCAIVHASTSHWGYTLTPLTRNIYGQRNGTQMRCSKKRKKMKIKRIREGGRGLGREVEQSNRGQRRKNTNKINKMQGANCKSEESGLQSTRRTTTLSHYS